MNTPQQLAPAGTMGVLRQGPHAASPSAEARGPVLPQRGASRQLELPFLAQAAVPRHRLRTG